MSTREDGEKLIQQAQKIWNRDLQSALQEADYNMTVRRAQEVVELTLKGL
jgi:HEPN domain-containing protein